MDHFIGLYRKYGWSRLELRVATSNGNKNIFWQVEKISLSEWEMQVWGYFGTQRIRNITKYVPPPIHAQALGNIANKN